MGVYPHIGELLRPHFLAPADFCRTIEADLSLLRGIDCCDAAACRHHFSAAWQL